MRDRCQRREKVLYINVYGLKNFAQCNKVCNPVGLGVYHSALQVGRYEFAFGGNPLRSDSGIYITPARRNNVFDFLYAIPVRADDDSPVCELTAFEIYNVLIPRLGQRYTADAYDVLTNNCNHFTQELLQILTAGRHRLPRHINKMANTCSIFHCIVPKRYLNAPPEINEGNAISETNHGARASSSYALLCNSNVLEWTNVQPFQNATESTLS